MRIDSIIDFLTTKKYEIHDENGNINEEKSRKISKHAILSPNEL